MKKAKTPPPVQEDMRPEYDFTSVPGVRGKHAAAPGFPGAGGLPGPRAVPQSPRFPGGLAGPVQEAPGALFEQRGQHVAYQYNVAGNVAERCLRQAERDVHGTPLQNLILSYLSHAGGTLQLGALLEQLALPRQSVVEDVWKLREKRWVRFQDPLRHASLLTTRIIDLGPS